MKFSLGKFPAAVACALALLGAFSQARAVTFIDTTPFWTGGDVCSFGINNTATYGQVITAPLTDVVLQNFTFIMEEPVSLAFAGYVYAWSGTMATGSALFAGPATSVAAGGVFQKITFNTGGITLTGGSQYVLFASASNFFSGHSGRGCWAQPQKSDVYAGGAFVFINNGSNSALWTTSPWTQNFLGTGGDLAFSAYFDTNVSACGHHTVHGHISTVPPSGHNGTVDSVHHGQHGHSVPVGVNCPPHAPGHSPGLTAEPDGQGLFSTSGLLEAPVFVAGVNQDGTLNGMPSELAGRKVLPARRGTVVQLFGSSEGLFLGAEHAGVASEFVPPASGSPLYYTSSLPEVRIGSVAAEVLFSGLAPGLKGVWQINVLIPEGAPTGTAPVAISYEGDELTSIALSIE
ncbi:MAG TPA: hypothetical protein VEU62_11100 [Bryobacterales bacterium]|nr:hypothetical protein [Bryobacterales bacterium]